MKLTIALQNEMLVKSVPIGNGGNIEIDIPDSCKRDLWNAQIEMWLEDGNGNIIDNVLMRSHMKTRKLSLNRR